MTPYTIRNHVKTTLFASIGSGDTSFSIVAASSPFNNPPTPSAGRPGVLTMTDNMAAPTKIEHITYSGITDNGDGTFTLTGVTRGAESTTAQSWTAGALIFQAPSSGLLNLDAPWPVTLGGTGLSTLTTGSFIRAASSTAFEQRTATQVRGDISAATAGAITGSGLTIATARIAGRTTASAGALEEIAIGAGLVLAAGVLSFNSAAVAITGGTITGVTHAGVVFSSSGSPGDNSIWNNSGTQLYRAAAHAFRNSANGVTYLTLDSIGAAVAGAISCTTNADFATASGKVSIGGPTGSDYKLFTYQNAGSGSSAFVARQDNTAGTIAEFKSAGGSNRVVINDDFLTLSGGLVIAGGTNQSGLRLNSPSANASSRNYAIGQFTAFGQIDFKIGASLGSDAAAGATIFSYTASAAVFSVPVSVTGAISATSTTFSPSTSAVANAALQTGSAAFGGGLLMRDGAGWSGQWMSSTGTIYHFGMGSSSGLTEVFRMTSAGISCSGAITASGNLLQFGSGSTLPAYLQHTAATLDIKGGSTGGVRILNNAGSVANVVFLDGGNVGIGNASPGNRLTVGNGSADTRIVAIPNSAFAFGMQNGANFGGWIGAAATNVIAVSDSGGTELLRFTSSGTVEKVGYCYDSELDKGNSTASDTVNWPARHRQRIVISQNTTLGFTSPGKPCSLILKVVTHSSAGATYTITWPAAIKWAGGVVPNHRTGNSKTHVFAFYFDGTNYFGSAMLDCA